MKRLLSIVLCIAFAQIQATAHTYYVKVGGNNGSAGTSEGTAWATIAYANSQLTAGDTVLILPGTYTDQIAPTNNGSSSAWIVYKGSNPNGRPVIHPTSLIRSAQLTNKTYVCVRDIGLTHGFEIDGGSHNMFYRDSCAFDESTIRANYYGIGRLVGSSFNIIRRCFFNRGDGLDAEYGGGAGMSITADASPQYAADNLIDSCMSIQASDAGYSQAGWQHYDRTAYVADTAKWCHTGFLIEDGINTFDTLLEYCVVQQCGINSADRDGTGKRLNGHAFELLGENSLIVRYCLAVNDTGVVGTHDILDNWYWDEIGISADYQTGVASNASDYYIYNNTIWGRCDNPEEHYIVRPELTPMGDSYGVTLENINFKNNIFARETGSTRLTYEAMTDVAHTNFPDYWFRNLFYRTTGTGVGSILDNSGYIGNFTIAELETSYPTRWGSNTLAYPKFIDTTSRGVWINLGLQAGSPAIDAGAPLTYANGSGSNTSLTVDDAGWFWAGNELVSGDSIKFNGQIRRIISRVGNTLTLDRAATWAADDPVYYYKSGHWYGDLPDLGAFEWYDNAETPPPPPANQRKIFGRKVAVLLPEDGYGYLRTPEGKVYEDAFGKYLCFLIPR
jgi:hypothetical protein